MLTTTPGSVVDGECQTGSGFLSVERYAKKHRPKIMVLENVSSLFSNRKTEGGTSPHFGYYSFNIFYNSIQSVGSSHFQILLSSYLQVLLMYCDIILSIVSVSFSLKLRYEVVCKRLKKLGYLVCGNELNARDFGVPQQRRRAWLLCMLDEDFADSFDTPTNVAADLGLFRRPCPSLDSCVDPKPGKPTLSKPKGSSKASKATNPPKWLLGFEKECERLGKARQSKRMLYHIPGQCHEDVFFKQFNATSLDNKPH